MSRSRTIFHRFFDYEPCYEGKARDPRWRSLRNEFIAANPYCCACGSFDTDFLIVHHIKPYHLFPDLELERSNLITLCERKKLNCHLWFGHLGNYKLWYNPEVIVWCSKFQEMLEYRNLKGYDDDDSGLWLAGSSYDD